MSCDLIKENLIDYIDGNLSEEERYKIEKHIESCEECTKEYNEILNTIDYLTSNGEQIEIKNDFQLKINKRKKSFKRTLLIACILSVFFVASVFAIEHKDSFFYTKKYSEEVTTEWMNLIENGVGQKLDISTIDNGIKVTAEGVIADDINTLILLKIEDLESNRRLSPMDVKLVNHKIKITGDFETGKINNFQLVSRSIFEEETNTHRLILKIDPLNKDLGNIKIEISQFQDALNSELTDVVDGNWIIDLSAEKLDIKEYIVQHEIEINKNKLIIDKIIVAPTATKISYTINNTNKEGKILTRAEFSLKHNDNLYDKSHILIGDYNSSESTSRYTIYKRDIYFQSIYLENPSEIDLILDSYEYSTIDGKIYDIKLDKLPQTIRYNGSKIVIEDIIFEDNKTEVIIKEDTSRRRKYIKTNIDIYEKLAGSIRKYDEVSDIIVKDEKHREIKDEDNENSYIAYNTQKIILEPNEFFLNITKEAFNKESLIPYRLYIEGQDFIEYTNKKINIKLK